MHDFKHAVFEALKLLVKDWLEHLEQLLFVSLTLLLMITRNVLSFRRCWKLDSVFTDHVFLLLVHRP